MCSFISINDAHILLLIDDGYKQTAQVQLSFT